MVRKRTATRTLKSEQCATETAEFGAVVPTREQVRRRAYELYEARRLTGRGGDAVTDWIAAERELKACTEDCAT